MTAITAALALILGFIAGYRRGKRVGSLYGQVLMSRRVARILEQERDQMLALNDKIRRPYARN